MTTAAIPIDASEAQKFNAATATDAQLEQGRQLIMDTFLAHNLGKQDWLDAKSRKVLREHKVAIETEQWKRRNDAANAEIRAMRP